MYDRLWSLLPGPFTIRVAVAVLATTAVVVLLMGLVFPTVENLLVPADAVSVP